VSLPAFFVSHCPPQRLIDGTAPGGVSTPAVAAA